MCGEKYGMDANKYVTSGSPPRVRGKARPASLLAAHRGITPACAGKSYPYTGCYIASEDHPRVCGEKPYVVHEGVMSRGSPPRVRGKDCSAGKLGGVMLDHPRVCGEK